jgi:hypothetical protein
MTRQLFATERSRVFAERVNSQDNSLTIFLCPTASISLHAEGLIKTLYLATPPQGPHHDFEIDTPFMSTLFKGSQIFRILGQIPFNSIIHHVRNGTIRCCRFDSESSVDLWFEIDSSSFE